MKNNKQKRSSITIYKLSLNNSNKNNFYIDISSEKILNKKKKTKYMNKISTKNINNKNKDENKNNNKGQFILNLKKSNSAIKKGFYTSRNKNKDSNPFSNLYKNNKQNKVILKERLNKKIHSNSNKVKV